MMRLALHPFLFAVAPILGVYSKNVLEVDAREVVRPLIGALTLALAVQVAASAVVDDPAGRAAASSLLIVAFFAYGSARAVASNVSIAGVELGRHRHLLPVWVLATAAAFMVGAWAGRRIPWLTLALTLVAASELLISGSMLARHRMRSRATRSTAHADRVTEVNLSRCSGRRDIYYVVLDRYAGRDVLKRMYGFDNSPFLEALTARGFWIPDKTFANYRSSKCSLASSLNMRYIHSDRAPSLTEVDVRALIRNNELGAMLRRTGYEFVNVGSWWAIDKHIPTADVNVSAGSTEFGAVLFEKTVLAALDAVVGRRDLRATHARAGRFQFEKLVELAGSEGDRPRFVYAHVLLPHLPYVFDKEGREISEREVAQRGEIRSYIEQLQFANDQILHLVDALQRRPLERLPVVVLQADEGQHPRDLRTPETVNDRDVRLRSRFDILNAVFLPARAAPGSAARWSPVNTFRYVLNEYFDAGLSLLPDRSFVYSRRRERYEFTEVTDRLCERSD